VLRPKVNLDTRAAVYLLWRLKPDELSRFICARDSLAFSLVVCEVLEAAAPLFALQVENVPFKFTSVPYLQALDRSLPEVDAHEVLARMLVQVANTPHWRGWLSATYQHPHAGSAESGALASALSQLEERHWSDFIDVAELSTSRGSAEAVAEILVLVEQVVGQERARAIWNLAFRRWTSGTMERARTGTFSPRPGPALSTSRCRCTTRTLLRWS
jgi:hypothetical protein